MGSFNFESDLRDHVANIEKALMEELARYRNSSFHDPLLYAIGGGKRIRPLILALSAESVGNKGENPLPAAVALELAHTESLIHDDVIDQDVSRRGQQSFYAKFGNSMAILSADFILAVILDIVTRYRNKRVVEEMAFAVSKMCEGEMKEIIAVNGSDSLNWNEYLDIVEKKTASLFCASAKIGAIIGDGSEHEIEALSNYGLSLGITYQLKDDLLDLVRRGTFTHSREISVKITDDKMVDRLKMLSDSYSRRAVHELRLLKNTKAKEYLSELAKFSVMRQF